MVFEKTLTDIVKGIRASKRDTALYISSCIAEIKSEINSTDPHTKGNALQKLTFLQMMGYNMSWASFATIEVMSDARFAYKRIGCLAATQTFTQDTDVILLTTNTLKKELRGAVGPGMNGVYEAGLALNCLSNIVTEDLARELLPDVTNLTNHPQPYLRKKAILCLLKLFIMYPQGLRLTFNRIQQCLLEDTNASVTSCAVNVITELSNTNPKNYLVLAPSFFGLLTNSSNNWMLIKVVKLLGSLVGEEPRLARKLLDPLAKIVQNTQAKSLLFEAVYTITLCLPYCQKADGSMPSNVPSIVALCAKTLKEFVQEADQNLKYLGLVGFGSLMVSHPKVLSAPDYRPLILACLSDEDVTIRTRALGLLRGMATRKNIIELVTQLLRHVDLASGSYKCDLVVKIIEICSSEKYALLGDFVWYMDVLVILARTKGVSEVVGGTNLGPLISGQIVDVALRVLPARSYTVRRMIGVLLGGSKRNVSADTNVMPEVLPSAAWIIGEYSSLIDEALSMDESMAGEDEDELLHYSSDSKGTYHAVIQALTDPTNVNSVEISTQRIYIQGAMKVLAAASLSQSCSDSELESILSVLSLYLPCYMQSLDPEVQERACTSFHLLSSLNLIDDPPNGALELTKTNEDEESESSSDEKEKDVGQKISSMTDDLLNLTMGSPSTSTKEAEVVKKPAATSKVGYCRQAAGTLKTLLIPEHMKPVSVKAQRKIVQNAPASIKEVLEKPLQISVFSKFIAADKSRKVDSKNLEAISFTEQKIHQTPMELNGNLMEGFESSEKMVQSDSALLGNPQQQNNLPSSSVNTALNSASRQQDPFYLNSSEHNGNANESGNRFGAIQLSDSENSESNQRAKRKKRKKKGKKSSKKIEDADLQLLGMIGGKDSSRHSVPQVLSSSSQPEIYRSDDDDDDELGSNNLPPLKKAIDKKSQLSSLADIDLTMPLRDDEVMPRNEHHVVKQRTEKVPKSSTKEKKRKAKSSKKQKKEGKKVYAKEVSKKVETSDNLLDFGTVEAVPTSPANPINAAFDDLLGLDMPPMNNNSDTLTLTTAQEAPSKPSTSTSNKKLKLWQKGTIKGLSAKGGNDRIDWSKISLHYRCHESKKKPTSFMVTIKLHNGTMSLLQGIELKMKGGDTIQLEDARPGTIVESSAKVGPFHKKADGYAPELRGSLLLSGWSVSIKLPLPSTFLLRPYEGLTNESVVTLLSEKEWSSESIKIQANKLTDAKKTMQHFLHADEVQSSGSDANAMFASQSELGAIVLALMKISKSSVKVDVKSNDAKLAATISSDLKRLLM